MLTLSFYDSKPFVTTGIAAEWLKNITSTPKTESEFQIDIAVEVDDNSYRYRALMQKPQLILKFSLPYFVDFPVGTWCVYQNQTFRLNCDKNLKKNGTRNITYNMTLGGDEDKLGLYKMRNSVDGRLKWSMCAKPHEFVEEVVKNLNKRDGEGVWSVGICLESTEKTVEFNHSYIDAALQSIADAFDTEWEFVNHVINLHKVEYNKDNPLPLSYGRGNGFVPGLGRTTNLDEAPIKRIYTQGGTRNIDRSRYGGEGSDFPEYATSSAELLLPPSQTLEYEGRTYKTDAQGYYVERVDKVSTAVKEDSLDCSEIYPSRVGKVGTVIAVNADKHFYDFIDTSIPDALDYGSKANIIDGETPTIIFQSGMLSGKEFEYKYKHSERRFEIVPQEIDGVIMPDPTTGYMPKTGDKYAVFGIRLPKQYFFDNETKTGASWDMFREAAKKLYESEDPKFTFKGDLQGLWAKRNWLNIGGKIVIGGYILFSDPQFATEGVKIRITGIKDYVNAPYAPTLEISNSVSGSTVRSELSKIDDTEVVIQDKADNLLQFTKRRFRDAQETIEMLEDAMLDNFTNSISPVAVQTMTALIGDESLQFRFVNNKTDLTPVAFNIAYSQADKQLHCPAGYLQHMTLGIKTVSSSHSDDEYKCWAMASFTSPVLDDGTQKYYLYALVNATDTSSQGMFALSTKSLPLTGIGSLGDISLSGKYCLLVGILNSEQNGERSFVTLYGYTEILPGRITTDKIVSSDGQTWFDLVKGEIHGNIRFSNNMNIEDVINAYNATIIEGGKIKTDLIEVANLVAQKLEVINENGAGVKIVPNVDNIGSVSIFNDIGNEVSIFEGKQYSSIAQLFDDSSGDVELNSYKAGSDSVIATLANNQSENVSQNHVLSDTWYTETPCEVFLLSGDIRCTANATGYETNGSGNRNDIFAASSDELEIGSSAHAILGISIYTYSDIRGIKPIHCAEIATCSVRASACVPAEDGSGNSYIQGDSKTQTLNCLGKSVKVPAGYHKLELHYNIYASRSGSSASVVWGSALSGSTDLAAEYKCNFYVSRFFANGFCLGLRRDNYVMAWNDGTDMNFAAETNGYGLKITPTGISYRPTAYGEWKSLR